MISLTTSNEIKSGCGLHGMIDLIVFHLLSNLVRHTLISAVWTGLPINPGASLAQPSCLTSIFCQTNRKNLGMRSCTALFAFTCTSRVAAGAGGGCISGEVVGIWGWGQYRIRRVIERSLKVLDTRDVSKCSYHVKINSLRGSNFSVIGKLQSMICALQLFNH